MLDYAATLEEAKKRYKKFKIKDPFPKIVPALLNSDDLQKYIAKTGMIYPFYPDPKNVKGNEKNVKGVSYRINILGKYVFWDHTGKKQIAAINKGDKFLLKSNTLVFVTIEPFIQLPAYIIARFNLTVNNVYRGLLLGTGPMIDAGFAGRISIPLHNFTTNDYILVGGEHLISMEFTKISPSLAKTQNYPTEIKESWDVEDYLLDADRHRPIQSSIPLAIFEAKTAAENAKDVINNFKRKVQISAIVAAIMFVFGIIALAYQTIVIYNHAVTIVKNTQTDFKNKYQYQTGLIDSLKYARTDIDSLKKEVSIIKKKLKISP